MVSKNLLKIACLFLCAFSMNSNAMLTWHAKEKEREQTLRHRTEKQIKKSAEIAGDIAKSAGHLMIGTISASGWGSAAGIAGFVAATKLASCKVAVGVGAGCCCATAGCYVGYKLAQSCFKDSKDNWENAVKKMQ